MPAERARPLIAVSVGIDLFKTVVLMIPFIGILINIFMIAPMSTIGLIHWLYAHYGISPGGRGGAQRLVLWFFLGPIPFSTTIGSLFAVRHIRKEDKRYNESQGIT